MDLRKIDKKLLARLALVVGIIIALVFIIIIIKLIVGNRTSYENIENKMITAAQKYYNDNSEELKLNNGGSTSITIEQLVNGKYIKNITKLTKDKEAVCSGKVVIYKNNDQLLYEPELNCGDYYKTTYFKDILLKEDNIVTSGDGLYKINDDYVFRGEKVKNYVKFDNKDWLILRINADGTIRMLELTNRQPIVWDDRYNIDKQYNSGKNNYSISRIKEYIEKIYNEEFSNKSKSYIIPQNLCIGSRNEEEENQTGDVECSSKMENQPLGLPQANEFLIASIEPTCKKSYDNQCYNYNYFTDIISNFWSITIADNSSHEVYMMTPSPIVVNASSMAQVKTTVHINSGVRYISGDGTKEKPYIFK